DVATQATPCPCVHGRAAAGGNDDAGAAALPLPSDLVLEIVARSDAATLVRCAACCKPLRRDILSPAFIRRVCRGPGAVVPPRLLGFLQSLIMPAASQTSSPPASFSLAHPATPAAACLSEKHLAPFLPGAGGGGLLARYDPVTSRGGLVVLRRHHYADESGICVYDPMTGGRTFLPDPPEMAKFSSLSCYFAYVLLTASDGIGCSFLLLAADLSPSSRSVEVRTAAVVIGGAVHWAIRGGDGDLYHILTYNVRTATAGSIKLPMNRLPKSYDDMNSYDANLRLASSPDGRLTMLVRDKLRIFVWLLSAGAGWARHAVIDTEAALLRFLMPLPPKPWLQHQQTIQLMSSWERSGMVLFDLVDGEDDLIALDVETKEMHRVNGRRLMPFMPFEARLRRRPAKDAGGGGAAQARGTAAVSSGHGTAWGQEVVAGSAARRGRAGA
uniref:DUF7595 domain-containing protein n=1 Tax=Setaria italica TaxID=4555 RepID=K3ZP45_SETIT